MGAENFRTSSLTSGTWVVALFRHSDGEARKLRPWTSSSSHRSFNTPLSQRVRDFKRGRMQQKNERTSELCSFVLTRGFVHTSASLQREKKTVDWTNGNSRHQEKVPAAMDRAWQVTPYAKVWCAAFLCSMRRKPMQTCPYVDHQRPRQACPVDNRSRRGRLRSQW